MYMTRQAVKKNIIKFQALWRGYILKQEYKDWLFKYDKDDENDLFLLDY